MLSHTHRILAGQCLRASLLPAANRAGSRTEPGLEADAAIIQVDAFGKKIRDETRPDLSELGPLISRKVEMLQGMYKRERVSVISSGEDSTQAYKPALVVRPAAACLLSRACIITANVDTCVLCSACECLVRQVSWAGWQRTRSSI